MCDFIVTPLLASMGATAGAATAAGATAAAGAGAAAAAGAGAATAGAMTAGAMLQQIGMFVGIGSSVIQGIQGYQANKQQQYNIAAQQQTEAQLTAVQDQRTRAQFSSQIRKQAAEIAARGFSLGSPSALLLGQQAAKELSFASQAVRSGGQAKQAELSGAKQIARARATSSLFKGGVKAAGIFVTAAPKVWPELLK